jgi:SAM-dependent methyltransferase
VPSSPSRPDPPLHELRPVERFSNRAADYARFRPDYPGGAIDCVLEGLTCESLNAADIGAGTGISARLLADRGVRVRAIEPNAAMRAAATPHSLVMWREGTAESTGLADGEVDLVLCAQAYHWFRHDQAIAEFHRVLRPDGRLALMWNRRDHDDSMTRGYVEAIHAVNGEHPAERMEFDPTRVSAAGLFTAPRLDVFRHEQALDREGLLGRATSASYVPKEGPGHAELTRRLDELYHAHRDPQGRVTLRYRTEVWRAQRRGG